MFRRKIAAASCMYFFYYIIRKLFFITCHVIECRHSVRMLLSLQAHIIEKEGSAISALYLEQSAVHTLVLLMQRREDKLACEVVCVVLASCCSHIPLQQ